MANQTPESVAAAVREARTRLGLSQRQLARRLHWPQPRLSRRETGEVEFRYSEIEAVADALGYHSTDDLLAVSS